LTDERFKIQFRGDIAEGFMREDVKAKLIELFGLKEQTVETLLDGQTATLKKNLDREGALKFKHAFEKTGAICYIRPMDEKTATSAPKPPSTPLQPSHTAQPAPTSANRSEPESFTVVDTSPEVPPEEEAEPVFEIPPGPSPGTMRCPKCEFVQPTADFCEACGVVVLKYLKREWEQQQLAKQLVESQQDTETDETAPQQPAEAVTTETESAEEVVPPPVSEPKSVPEPATTIDRTEPEAFTVVDTDVPPPATEPEPEPEPVFEIPPGPSPGTMRCPKCEFVQPSADFCEVCGVVILKYLKREWEQQLLAKQLEESQQDAETDATTPQGPAEATTTEPMPPKKPVPPPAPEPAPTPAATERREPETFTVVDTSEPSPATEPEPVFEPPPGPSPGTMRCPKCEFVQPLGDFCEACGIVVLKYLQRQAAEREQAAAQQNEDDSDKEADLGSLSLATPTGVTPTVQSSEVPTHDTSVSPQSFFDHVLPRSLSLLKERAGSLLLLWSGALLSIATLGGYHADLGKSFSAPYPSLLVAIGMLLIVVLSSNATLFLLIDQYLPLKPALALGLLRLPSFVWLYFWHSLIMTGATLALLVPGYFFTRWFSLAPLCLAAEQTRGFSSLLRSRAYCRGREKLVTRALWPALLFPLSGLIGLMLLPGYWKLLPPLVIPPFFSVLTVLYQDAAASRTTLNYDNTLSQRLQWPALSMAGLLVFTIVSLLVLGPGRIRSSIYTLLLHTELVPTVVDTVTEKGKPIRPAVDSAVFELEIEGYVAFAYINGETILERPDGVAQRQTFTSPVKLQTGRNILAIRYSALPGSHQPEMTYRVFRWNLKTLQDEELGTWSIHNQHGLRRVEFYVSKTAESR